MGAVGRVHRLVALRGRELVGVAGFANLQASGDPGGGTSAQGISVEALGGADAAGASASVAERDRDRVVRMASLNPDGAGDFLAVQFEFDNVFDLRCPDAQPSWDR